MKSRRLTSSVLAGIMVLTLASCSGTARTGAPASSSSLSPVSMPASPAGQPSSSAEQNTTGSSSGEPTTPDSSSSTPTHSGGTDPSANDGTAAAGEGVPVSLRAIWGADGNQDHDVEVTGTIVFEFEPYDDALRVKSSVADLKVAVTDHSGMDDATSFHGLNLYGVYASNSPICSLRMPTNAGGGLVADPIASGGCLLKLVDMEFMDATPARLPANARQVYTLENLSRTPSTTNIPALNSLPVAALETALKQPLAVLGYAGSLRTNEVPMSAACRATTEQSTKSTIPDGYLLFATGADVCSKLHLTSAHS